MRNEWKKREQLNTWFTRTVSIRRQLGSNPRNNVLVRVLDFSATPNDPFRRLQSMSEPRKALLELLTPDCGLTVRWMKTMSINSWCLIQTIRYLTQNLTRLLRTDEGKFDMCCRHHQPQHVKRSLNILSVPPAKLWYGFQPHVWNRDANIFCANTWLDQQICLDLAGSTLLL